MATNAPTAAPVMLPLYLLDGQQRLTSLHRVFTDDPRAQLVFNVDTEKFQNQSAATKKDPKWVKVHDILTGSKLALLAKLVKTLPDLGEEVIASRLERVGKIGDYPYHLEILSDLTYEQVTEIFVRVNSRGRAQSDGSRARDPVSPVARCARQVGGRGGEMGEEGLRRP